ncbi:MAG TPA: carbamoyltransferase HypF, partial [Clostridiales bacterium]|nr:carbamoyltransferase HypF [Clostridiales bacterium]
MKRYVVTVNGMVQGVGFRPFVYHLATALRLCGFVQNTADGVCAEIQGSDTACTSFLLQLKENAPPPAHIESLSVIKIPLRDEHAFAILPSREGETNTQISPDTAICPECANEIADETNRRYRYALTNCTRCGPRFTIVKNMPYDRKNASLADFPMCDVCRAEYENPHNRRFHAQPNACAACGPKVKFYEKFQNIAQDPYLSFVQAIHKGEIVAIKGIGGFHLSCDAANEEAVKLLRKRKLRYDKPFAVMMRDIQTVQKHCFLTKEEQVLLLSPQTPIVLLKKKPACAIAPSVTLTNQRIGVMLPYAPLQCICMEFFEALIMTSGNLSDRPMVYLDDEAFSLLPRVADHILTHNRPIVRRMDDSVAMVVNSVPRLIRRARGYVPEPLPLQGNTRVILAVGPQQKNTFCLAKGEHGLLSGHMGDLRDIDTSAEYVHEMDSYIQLFDGIPEAVACDLHPDYVSTAYASRYQGSIPIFPIQHHHAHFASVLAEHNLQDHPAIGMVFDGTGYGEDGTIWGGELLFGTVRESKRMGHLDPFPLLGGEQAIREPWRIALSLLDMACGRETALSRYPGQEAPLLLQAGDQHVNAPLTSSMGRLFDGVCAIIGVKTHVTYEGQAAIELQQIMDSTAKGSYHFELHTHSGGVIFHWQSLIRALLLDHQAGVSPGVLSAR